MSPHNPLPTLLLLLLLFPTLIHAHAELAIPPQRGLLPGSKFSPYLDPVDKDAEHDSKGHFPAGDKDDRPGAGKLSQERETDFNWKPFQPHLSTYHWPAGVCGDLKGPRQDHLKGGQYYHNAMIVREYPQGGTLEATVTMVAHHNGFFEFRLCDVDKCPGKEISEACFRQGHCHLLQRVSDPQCDSGDDKMCGPKDPNYPGRWYVPCKTADDFDRYGGKKMRFHLPKNLHCEHCVLHWYYGTANGCNPPGVVDYFEGPHGPNWGTCKGAGGAIGGYTKVQKPCGGRQFAEEYFQCADIRIIKNGRTDSPGKQPRPVAVDVKDPPKPQKPEPTRKPNTPSPNNGCGTTGPISFFRFFADGRIRRRICRGTTEVINVRDWTNFAIEAVTSRKVSKVEFFIDGKKIGEEYSAPYFMNGDIGVRPKPWKTPIFNRKFKLQARTEGIVFSVNVRLVRQN